MQIDKYNNKYLLNSALASQGWNEHDKVEVEGVPILDSS